jgi:hypothetical protein
MTQKEERIRERAKQIWEQAGKPEGRDEEFWLQAEQQIILEEQDTRPDPTAPPRRL